MNELLFDSNGGGSGPTKKYMLVSVCNITGDRHTHFIDGRHHSKKEAREAWSELEKMEIVIEAHDIDFWVEEVQE